MFTKTLAHRYADEMAKLHDEPWIVFRTPDGAAFNQHPANLYNSGRYAACAASERAVYEAGGAEFEAQ